MKITQSIAWVVGTVLVIALAVGWWFFNQMSQPLYAPGALKNTAVAEPPQSSDTAFWEMGDGIRLHHFAEGTGANILTLHGGPGIPWKKPVEGFSLLAGPFRVNYFDQRGCGQSTRPFDRFASSNYFENMTTLESKLGIGAQLKDIERIRQILGEDKVILVGHSFGALLAALYAAEFPEKVKALVLITPADLLKMPTEKGDLFATVRKDLPAAMQVEFDVWHKNYFDFGGIFKKSEADLQNLNRDFAIYYGEAMRVHGLTMPEMQSAPESIGGWATHAMYFSMGKKHDWRAAMRAVTAPVLVIHGANDLQPEAASRAFADNFPNSKVEVIAGAGHFPFYEKPAEFAAVVWQFLEGKSELTGN